MSDRDEIEMLRRRVTELENTRCPCCEPLVMTCVAHAMEVNHDWGAHDNGTVTLRLRSPWGDIKIPLDHKEGARAHRIFDRCVILRATFA